jgi:biopolymer transport protein ExbD
MAQGQRQLEAAAEEDMGPVLPRRPMRDSIDLDITPMIDVTFLLLVFFLVCSTMSAQSSVDLPPAQFGDGVGEHQSVVFSILPGAGDGPARVFLGNTNGERLSDDLDVQEARILEEVQKGVRRGHAKVLIKAAKDLKHREVSRVATVAGSVAGVSLHMAVMQME